MEKGLRRSNDSRIEEQLALGSRVLEKRLQEIEASISPENSGNSSGWHEAQ
jgi:hypothetical protein